MSFCRYLADNSAIENSQRRLAKILNYELKRPTEREMEKWILETKSPTQVFLGLNSGSLVSLADQKVFEPTHLDLIDYYNPAEPLSDHLH